MAVIDNLMTDLSAALETPGSTVPKPTKKKYDHWLPAPGDPKLGSTLQNSILEAMRDRDTKWIDLWMRCFAFQNGSHWWKWGMGPGGAGRWTIDTRVPSYVTRKVQNRLRPTIRQVTAMLTSEPTRLTCSPASPDYDDVNRAEIGTSVLEAIMGPNHLRVSAEAPTTYLWECVNGFACREIWWDESGGPWSAQTTTDPMTGEAQVDMDEDGKPKFKASGKFRNDLYPPPQTIADMNATSHRDAEWIACGSVMTREEAKRKFPGIKLRKPEDRRPETSGDSGGTTGGSLASNLRRIYSFIGPEAYWWGFGGRGGYGKAPEGVDCFRFFLAPCEYYPSGRTIMLVDNEVVYDEPCQTEGKERFPLAFYEFDPTGVRFYADGLAQDLVPVQEELNRALSDLVIKRKANTNPKYMIPFDLSIPDEAMTTNPTEIVRYHTATGIPAPTILQAPGILDVEFQYLNYFQSIFDFMAGLSQATQGENPPGVRSERQLSFLKGQNSQRLRMVMQRNRETDAWIGKYALFLVSRYWTDEMLIAAVGADLRPFIGELRASDFATDFDVKVGNGIALPEDSADRANMLNAIFTGPLGQLSPDMQSYYFDLLNVGDVSRLVEDKTREEVLVRAKFLSCINGRPETMDYFEDPETGRRILKTLMTSQKYLRMPEEKKALVTALDESYHAAIPTGPPMGPDGQPLPPGTSTPEQMHAQATAAPEQQPQGSPPKPVTAG